MVCKGVRKQAYGFKWKYNDISEPKQAEVSKPSRKPKRVKKPVNQYDSSGNFIATYESIMKASAATHVTDSNISHCVTGKQLTAGGFRWEYAE